MKTLFFAFVLPLLLLITLPLNCGSGDVGFNLSCSRNKTASVCSEGCPVGKIFMFSQDIQITDEEYERLKEILLNS